MSLWVTWIYSRIQKRDVQGRAAAEPGASRSIAVDAAASCSTAASSFIWIAATIQAGTATGPAGRRRPIHAGRGCAGVRVRILPVRLRSGSSFTRRGAVPVPLVCSGERSASSLSPGMRRIRLSRSPSRRTKTSRSLTPYSRPIPDQLARREPPSPSRVEESRHVRSGAAPAPIGRIGQRSPQGQERWPPNHGYEATLPAV